MTRTEPGQGPLNRVTAVVYWFLVVEGLLVVTTAPGLVAMIVLDRHPSNLPLYALAAVPFGPAVAAALFAWQVFLREPDLSPAHHFWRGYRLNVADALRTWVPALVALTVLGTVLVLGGAAGVQVAPAGLYLVLVAAVGLWTLRMLAITSSFAFRWRDAARISVFTLVTQPVRTLGLGSLLVLTGGIVLVTFDAVAVLLACVLTFLLARNEAPVLAEVRARFTEPAAEPAD